MKDASTNLKNISLHKSLIKLNRTHKKMTHAEFTKIGLTEGQPKILRFLLNHDGCIQREIAENCYIEPATVTSLLANMEKSGLIYRTANPNNRRILNVFITTKGMDSQKKVEEIFNSIDEKCFKGFSEEEKLNAIAILDRLYENLIKEANE